MSVEAQDKLLEYCRAYFAQNDQLPSTRTISSHFGWKSQTTAMTHVQALILRGELERNDGGGLRFARQTAITTP